jgi:hypothetical protein
MWSTLIEAWLDSDRMLPRCRPDELGAGTAPGRPRTALHRRHILQCWPEGRVTADLLRAHLAWCRPRMVEAAEQSADVLTEVEMLGLVVGGLPTEALATLPGDVAAAAAALPAPVNGGLIVQPDLTVIAPLNLDAQTWTLLHEVSRVESWGPVVMHRIDPPLIRAAVGSRAPDDLLSRLATASRTPLPQSLEYLVRDAARSRPVRLWHATLLRAGEQDAETLRDLGLDELAPGTFTSPQAVDVVRERLERAGLGIEAVTPAEPGTPLEFPRVAGHDPRAVDRLVTRLVGSDRVDEPPPALHPADPATLAATFQQAVADGRSLWLEFREGDATLTHLVEPLDVRSGKVSGWSLTAGRSVTVPLSRIAATGDPT